MLVSLIPSFQSAASGAVEDPATAVAAAEFDMCRAAAVVAELSGLTPVKRKNNIVATLLSSSPLLFSFHFILHHLNDVSCTVIAKNA